jgi:tRNA-guanine family transglycosylase
MRTGAASPKHLKLPGHDKLTLPLVWLGQSVRTTVVTRRYPFFSQECWMVSLGDAVHRPRLIEKVFHADIRERIGVHGPLMLDSGGFTMMMHKQSLAIETIAKIYRIAQAELCITLDLPPTGADNSRVRSRKYRKTRENLAHLVEAVGARRIVPVVHGTTVREVEDNCLDIAGLIAKPRMICLGGLVPLLRRSGQPAERDRSINWLSGLVARVRVQFPRSVIHVLGAGSPQNIATVIACGADSTDSLAWRRAAGFGTIYLPGTGERFVAPRDRARANSRPTLDDRELELLEACLCPACDEFPRLIARLAELQKSYLARAAHNAFVILAGAKRVSSTKHDG